MIKGIPLPWYITEGGRFYDLELYLEIMSIVHHTDSTIRFLMIGELPKKIQLHKPPNLEILPAMGLESLAKILSSCHLGICLLRDLPAMKNAFPAKAYDFTMVYQFWPVLKAN